MRVFLTGPVRFTVTVVGWLGLAASSLSLSSFALLLSVLWGLWRRQNTWVHERSLYLLHLVVEDAVLLCHDYASASASAQVSPLAAAAPPHWRPPPVGSIKVNIDGAFLPSARLGAIGVIARDSSGAVLGGLAKPIPIQGPASTVEVAALFAGHEFAIANDWPSALIESDAAVLVKKLLRPTADLSLFGDMLAPSRALLAANVARLRVGFTPHLANIATHTLASWACNNNDDVLHVLRDCPDSSTALCQAGFNGPLLSNDQVTVVGWLGLAASSLSLSVPLHCYFLSFGASGDVVTLGFMSVASIRYTLSLRTMFCSAVTMHRRLPPPRSPRSLLLLPPLAPTTRPASTVEVAALFAGLEFAIANDWPSALIESDASVLVKKPHRPTSDLSLLGDMLAPSRALLAANAARFRVGFTLRLANIAAHTLASWACNNNDVITFSSVCPEFISRIVLDDLSSSF
ncbi:hypothetical protein GQ457_05G022800 [Hibiscus cannabinus]